MLLVREIYPAILGESRLAGRPCLIVRLTGCHRRCPYCDTVYAFQGGERLSCSEILARVNSAGLALVLLTGGEPLLQPEVCELAADLLADGRQVVLETSGTTGTIGLDRIPAGVVRVVDLKTPGSGIEAAEIDWTGIAGLEPTDELKAVCCDRRDYLWLRELVRSNRLPAAVPVTVSPAHGEMEARQLAEWILADRLDVRLQLQLHRVLWPDAERGV